jgi:uncharacterized protein YydD (DUF2326 family)
MLYIYKYLIYHGLNDFFKILEKSLHVYNFISYTFNLHLIFFKYSNMQKIYINIKIINSNKFLCQTRLK